MEKKNFKKYHLYLQQANNKHSSLQTVTVMTERFIPGLHRMITTSKAGNYSETNRRSKREKQQQRQVKIKHAIHQMNRQLNPSY